MTTTLAGPAAASPDADLAALAELLALPRCAELRDVDLDLQDRSRVSALPWRGQFSPLTVDRIMDALMGDAQLVLDPFLGSGTVLLEAARRGRAARGFDINPAAIAFASCAALAALPAAERTGAVERARAVAFADDATARLAGAPIGVAHALALLGQALGSPEAAVDRVTALVDGLGPDPTDIRAVLGDARATGLADGAADFVITSPPYINVFNYHQYGRPMTDAFRWPVLTAARSEVGSNRQNRGNRFRTVAQYAIDMALALAELSRVLVPGSTAVLIVGRESRVRGVPFYNGELIARVARGLGCFGARTRAERRFVSRFGEVIWEDVLVLSDSSPVLDDPVAVKQIGRQHGVQALREARAPADRQDEIDAAVDAAAAIDCSPVTPPAPPPR